MRVPPFIPLAALSLFLLTACAPEPSTSATTGTGTPPSASSPVPAVSASPTVDPSQAPIGLPTSCDELNPTELADTLRADVPPMNDPALADFLSTENVAGLEVLASASAVLRCTWGAAGTPGLATTVAPTDEDDSATVRASLEANGFACEELEGGVACRLSHETIDQSDQIRTNGETHWFGNGVWVATHWVDYDPVDYTRALAVRLAG